MKISLWLTPAVLMIAIVLAIPNAIGAADNVTQNATQPLPPVTEPSFWDTFPWYIWLIFGLVFLALILLVGILLFAPKKKKGTQPGMSDKKQMMGQPGQYPQQKSARPMPQQGMPMQQGMMPPQQGMPQQGMPMQQGIPQQRLTPQPSQSNFGQPPMSPNFQQPQMAQPVPPNMGGEQFGQFKQPPPQPGMRPQPRAMPQQMGGMSPQPMQNPMQPRMAPQQQAAPSQMQGQQQPQPRPMPQQMPPPQQPQAMQPRPVMPQQAPPQQPMYKQPAPQPMQMRPGPPVMPQPAYSQQGFGVKTRPVFSIGNLNIFPSQVKEGDPVTVSAVITNSGSSTGKYSAVLRIDNVVENIAELTLNPGASQTATFSIIKDVAGEYVVEVDNLRGILFVIPKLPAAFTTSNLTINPDRVSQGRPIAIGITITNTGEKPGIYNAVLKVKGATEISEDIPMEPLETKEVVFNISKDAAGFYPVSFEHMTGRFVVEMDWNP